MLEQIVLVMVKNGMSQERTEAHSCHLTSVDPVDRVYDVLALQI